MALTQVRVEKRVLDRPVHGKVSVRSSRILALGSMIFGMERSEILDSAIRLWGERMQVVEKAREMVEGIPEE